MAAALTAAVLFGCGTPIAKLLLPGTGPLPLAALLYLGAGIGLSVLRLARRAPREAPLRRGDLPLLAGIVIAGGVTAPVLLLLGLERLPAVDASLLLNLEAPFTVLLAVALFGEHLGARAGVATALIVCGGVVLSGASPDVGGSWLGSLLVAAACAAWAVDNNLTQRLSLRDPVAITLVKTLAAGAIDLTLALATGHALPAWPRVAAALALGTVSYGASIALAVRAMRLLGAARQAALFALAPFAGALASVPLLGERLEPAAAALMAAGVVLLLRERHEHEHVHEPLEHDHLHVHDAHHDHAHAPGVPPGEPHSHPHRHERLSHAHPHVSDAHHRHGH
jgi:drug/metabolite transporter (DMT)-like permease